MNRSPGLNTSSNIETTSFLSYGGKSNGMNMTLANKISMALSRVVSTKSNGQMVDSSDEEEEIQDLMQLIEELNSHADLTVKLNN